MGASYDSANPTCDDCQSQVGCCTECGGCFSEHCECDPCQHGKARSEECGFCVRGLKPLVEVMVKHDGMEDDLAWLLGPDQEMA